MIGGPYFCAWADDSIVTDGNLPGRLYHSPFTDSDTLSQFQVIDISDLYLRPNDKVFSARPGLSFNKPFSCFKSYFPGHIPDKVIKPVIKLDPAVEILLDKFELL